MTRSITTSRIVALMMGPFYLWFVTMGLYAATRAPIPLVIAAVFVAATAIMVTLCVFGVKSTTRPGPVRQYGLDTVFLFVIPVAIYLGAIRIVVRGIPTDDFTIADWTLVAVLGFLFMMFSTFILLHFAEALMWLAVVILKTVRK